MCYLTFVKVQSRNSVPEKYKLKTNLESIKLLTNKLFYFP